MVEPLVIGLDLGTTLCKAVAFEMDGALRAQTQQVIHTFRPADGWAEQDPQEWIASIFRVLADLSAQLKEETGKILALGVSCHGPSLILADEHFSPLGRCPIWQDQRATHLCAELLEKAGAGWVGLGMPESSFGVQLYWALQNHPEQLGAAKHIFDTKGFLLASLTGRAVDEYSSSPGGKDWNQEFFAALGVDVRKLPNSIASTSVAGELQRDICERTGLPPGLPVIAGLNDGAAAALGAGLVQLGQGIVSLSTNGVMRTTLPRRLPGATLVAKSMFCYPYVEGMYVTGGTTKCGGDSVGWFIENFLAGYAMEEKALFDLITADAARSPVGANGVFFMPYLVGMGSPSSQPGSRGAFLNLGRHHTRSDLARALFEGVAFALRDIAETFSEMGLGWENLRFTGGGSKNPLWRQIVSDVLGRELCGVRSDSALGAAILAAVGAGYFPSPREAATAMVHRTFQVSPISANIAYYDHLYAQFSKVKLLLKSFNEQPGDAHHVV